MDFDDVRFPPLISFGAVGGPRFETSVATMASGAESRNQNWELDRGEWEVSFTARIKEEWMPLVSFFRVIAKGRANTFRFKDWTDYVALTGEGLFVDDDSGSPTLRQMVKRYTYGNYTYDRYITKPISGKITTDAVGLDYASGLALSGTTWSGEFDCWCRLNNDPMRLRMIDKNDHGFIVGWSGIEIVEVTSEAIG